MKCGDAGCEQHDSSWCRVGQKASVVKQLIGKLQQKSNVCFFFFNLETLFFLISGKLVTVYLMGNSEGKVSKGHSIEMKKRCIQRPLHENIWSLLLLWDRSPTCVCVCVSGSAAACWCHVSLFCGLGEHSNLETKQLKTDLKFLIQSPR